MFIKKFTRTVKNYSVPFGARPSKRVMYRSSNYDKFNNLLKTTTGIKSKFFNIIIEKGPNDIFWSIYEHSLLKEEKMFVKKFLKLNQVKSFVEKQYNI